MTAIDFAAGFAAKGLSPASHHERTIRVGVRDGKRSTKSDGMLSGRLPGWGTFGDS